jgi:hypothetical protein
MPQTYELDLRIMARDSVIALIGMVAAPAAA